MRELMNRAAAWRLVFRQNAVASRHLQLTNCSWQKPMERAPFWLFLQDTVNRALELILPFSSIPIVSAYLMVMKIGMSDLDFL